jgi:hypothetical protein
VTFENGEVKEICVAITFDCPTSFRFGWPREQAQAHRRLTDHLPNGKWKETTISPSIIYQLA